MTRLNRILPVAVGVLAAYELLLGLWMLFAPRSFFDQIAWFTNGNREALTLSYRTAGTFDWTEHILREVERNSTKEARISDHFPLWAEFGLGD